MNGDPGLPIQRISRLDEKSWFSSSCVEPAHQFTQEHSFQWIYHFSPHFCGDVQRSKKLEEEDKSYEVDICIDAVAYWDFRDLPAERLDQNQSTELGVFRRVGKWKKVYPSRGVDSFDRSRDLQYPRAFRNYRHSPALEFGVEPDD